MKTPVVALLYKKTGEIIYSRARHDFRTTKDGECFIDGGFEYTSYGGSLDNYEIINIEIPLWTADLYNDWSRGEDKYGYIPPEEAKKIKRLTKEEILPKSSLDYQKLTAIWGTKGPNGDGPTTYINLLNAQTDHLEQILKNCHYISENTKKIIKSILSDRMFEQIDVIRS